MLIVAAAVTAFLISTAVGKFLIPILRAMKAGQSIKEIGPNWHKGKEGTPTMGGIMFIVAILIDRITQGMSKKSEEKQAR